MKNTRGGKREGAGRKSKQVEETQCYLIEQAIRRITNENDSEESKIKFLAQLAVSESGRMWLANKYFGKPTEHTIHATVESSVNKEGLNISKEEARVINEILEKEF